MLLMSLGTSRIHRSTPLAMHFAIDVLFVKLLFSFQVLNGVKLVLPIIFALLLASNPTACLGLAAAALGCTLLFSLSYRRLYGNPPGTSVLFWYASLFHCFKCFLRLHPHNLPSSCHIACLLFLKCCPLFYTYIFIRYIRNAVLFVSFCLSIIGAALVNSLPPPGLSDASAFNDSNVRRYAVAALAVSAFAFLAVLIAEIIRRRASNK